MSGGGGGGGGGNRWKVLLLAGAIGCGIAYALEHAHVGPGALQVALLAAGGLAMIFASCEAMRLRFVRRFC